MRALTVSLTLFLAACPSGDGEIKDSATDSGGGGGTDRTFEDFVNTTEVWTGDTTCYTPGAAWNVLTPDPTCQVDVTLSSQVLDFQEDEPVADATVQLWANDDVTSSDFVATTADGDGSFSIDGAQTCSPFAYGTSTPPEWEATVNTLQVHQVYGYTSEGSVDVEFFSVSETTARIIPGLIGVEWDRTTGIIAGTAYDCNEDPIENAEIFIHDGNNVPPATGDVFYFSTGSAGDLPTDLENQPDSNTNGLWVAINVPEGTWTVEMWGWDGGAYQKLGAVELTMIPGSVNIANIYTGLGDGIYYPASCTSACGG